MYNWVKNCVKKIIPINFLYTHEESFRAPYAFFYKGSNHECVICNQQLKKFITVFEKPQLCPYCGSLARARRLYDSFLKDQISGKVLHFSPPRMLYRRLKKNKAISYYSSDFEDEFLADYRFDITKIDVVYDFFDYIICYHVLEHITQDRKAIQELHRTLKKGGKAFIQTPFKTGEIYENETITTPAERLRHFGQEDHVRIYSVAGLVNRLKSNGFSKCTVKQFKNTLEDNRKGLTDNEVVIIAEK